VNLKTKVDIFRFAQWAVLGAFCMVSASICIFSVDLLCTHPGDAFSFRSNLKVISKQNFDTGYVKVPLNEERTDHSFKLLSLRLHGMSHEEKTELEDLVKNCQVNKKKIEAVLGQLMDKVSFTSFRRSI